MSEVVGRVLALAVAGFDPTGAILLVGAIAAKASRTKVLAFTAALFVASVVIGTAMALASNSVFGESLSLTSGPFRAYFEVGMALFIGIWLADSLRSTRDDARPRRNIAQSTPAMTLGGVIYALSTVPDPSFPATAVIVGPSGAYVAVVSFLIRTVISQALLIALVVAFLFDAHEKPVEAMRRWYERHKVLLIRILNASLVLIAVAALADAGTYFATDDYLITW